MTVRTERIFVVACNHDGCTAEHHKPDVTSAMEARIAAGMDGWGFRRGNGNSRNPDKRPDTDACPEHASTITQKERP